MKKFSKKVQEKKENSVAENFLKMEKEKEKFFSYLDNLFKDFHK